MTNGLKEKMVENLMATPESEFNRKLERKKLDEDIDNYLGPLQDEKELETLINSPSPESKKNRKNSGPISPYRKPEAAHTKQANLRGSMYLRLEQITHVHISLRCDQKGVWQSSKTTVH